MNTKTRGICLTIKDPDIEDGFFPEPIISFQASKLGRMQELHLLRVDGCNMVHNGSCSGYQQLRWVQWRSYRFRSFSPQLELPQLVVLDLSYSDELRCLWEENIYVVVSLIEFFPTNMIGQKLKLKFLLCHFCCNGYYH